MANLRTGAFVSGFALLIGGIVVSIYQGRERNTFTPSADFPTAARNGKFLTDSAMLQFTALQFSEASIQVVVKSYQDSKQEPKYDFSRIDPRNIFLTVQGSFVSERRGLLTGKVGPPGEWQWANGHITNEILIALNFQPITFPLEQVDRVTLEYFDFEPLKILRGPPSRASSALLALSASWLMWLGAITLGSLILYQLAVSKEVRRNQSPDDPHANAEAATPLGTPDDALAEVPRNEPWRGPTGLRFLERLKAALVKVENEFLQQHANRALGIAGISITTWDQRITATRLSMFRLRQRVEKIFQHVVQDEIVELDVTRQKLELERQEITVEIQHLGNDQSNRNHRSRIKEIDRELIDVRADLEELRNWSAIPRHPEGANARTPDEEQFEAALKKERLYARWKVEQKLGTKVRDLQELDRWKEHEESAINHDAKLSLAERQRRLAWIARLYEEQRAELMGEKGSESIFEA